MREGNLSLSAWSETIRRNCASWPTSRGGSARCAPTPRATHERLDDSSEAAVRAALDGGHADVVSATPLIVMLTALRLATAVSP